MKFTNQLFTLTTADDQENYFSGNSKSSVGQVTHDIIPKLQSGMYRIIDGKMYHIVSGLHVEEVKTSISDN